MAWIAIDDDEGASAELDKVYRELFGDDRPSDNILRIHSLNPRSLRGHYELYTTVMHRRSELSRAEREMIGVVVSAINRCHY